MQQTGLKKNDILESILVEKLVFSGMGFAKLKHSNPDLDGRVIFITGGAIPGSIVNLRVLKKKKSYIETQIVEVIKKSPIEKIHPNNPYGFAGAWKWINIPYEEQLKIKENQVKEAFRRIENGITSPNPLQFGEVKPQHEKLTFPEELRAENGGLSDLTPPFCSSPLQIGEGLGVRFDSESEQGQTSNIFLPIIGSPIVDGYRNKVEFSFGKYISHKEGIEEHFNVGFHKQGEFSKVIDFDGTPLIDETQNEIYREIKKITKTLGLPVYDQMKQEGFFRHILLRKSYFNDEMMILLSFNPEYFEKNKKLDKGEKLNLIKNFLLKLAKKYPIIKSIYFSHNLNKADTAIGDLELIYGEKTIKETLHGLDFNISPTSFFQTNSPGAEKLYEIVLSFGGISESFEEENLKHGNVELQSFDDRKTLKIRTDGLFNDPEINSGGHFQGEKLILDLYSGTGTIGMIFAKAGARKVISVELVESASKDGEKNAKENGLENIEFVNAKVEDFLGEYLSHPKCSLASPNWRGLGEVSGSSKCKSVLISANEETKLLDVSGSSVDGKILDQVQNDIDLIIIDPPRAGMHPKALENILKFEAKQIIYVSCNPATLVRDLEYILQNSEYKLEKVQAMDMFPHTHHIETVVSLVKD